MNKINSFLLLSATVMTYSFFLAVPRAEAIPVKEIGANLFTNIKTTIEQTMDTIEQTISTELDVVEKPMAIKDFIQKYIDRYGMPAMKKSAITLSNAITQKIVGGGGSGSPQFVQDWNEYLYVTPAQEASVYMNSFFDQTSRGANSPYSRYMVSQAQQGLQGSDCDTTNIQNYASDPNRLFADGNMRGLMAYTQPCGNPYSYSAIAQSKFQTKYAQRSNIKEKETANGGWTPKKENGIITIPANLYASAQEGADQMGNNMIVNATTWQELAIAAAFRVGASLMQYQFGASSKNGDSYFNTANQGYSFVQKAYSGN